MFKNAKFIYSYAKCEKSYSLEKFVITRCLILLIGVFYFLHSYVNLSIDVQTVIIHFINCHFYLFYCVLCKLLWYVSVSTHDCNVINLSDQFLLFFKYYNKNLPHKHSHKLFFIKLIYILKRLQIKAKSTMICS